MTRPGSEYQQFEASSTRRRRLLRQEELILEVTEALANALEREGISKKELADRLGKTKGFVSQVFSGGRNLTLRTVADFADALHHRIRVTACKGVQATFEAVLTSHFEKGPDHGDWLRSKEEPVTTYPYTGETAA
jgi:transcriptional regulator with XRE-family HTH domain